MDAPTTEPKGITFPLPRIRQIVLDHDKTMDDQRDEMMEAKAIYETKWWPNYVAQGTRRGIFGKGAYQWDGAEIEVNHLHRMMRTYLSDLFPDASRAVCDPDPEDRGDPQAIQAVLNDWGKKPYVYLTVDHETMMSLIVGGGGWKIGYDPGTGNPIDRVWMRPIPPWELILDRDAPSWEDERYRGHIYQSPVEEVLQRYPQLEGRIKGAPRLDFFQQSIAGNPVPDPGQTSQGEYVRVLEFLNLRDPYVSETGEVFKGRMEVYVLGCGEASNTPVVVTPLPFQDASGRDLPNPQQTELNKVRTAMARDTRRNARKFVYRDGAIEQDQIDMLTNGVDGQGVKVKQDVPIAEAITLLPNQPISSDNITYMKVVEADLNRVTGPSQNAQGQTTDVTKYELMIVQSFAEALLKYHAKLLYGTLSRVFRLVQRAVIAAAQDSGDSEAGDEVDPITDLAGPDDESEPKPVAKVKPARPAVHPFESFTIKSGELKWTVTEDMLNADCPISFVGADNTPINRATMVAFMTGPGLESYMALWDMVQKGGAVGLLAERSMQHIAEAMNLPKDMHPSAMKAQLKKEAPVESAKVPKGVGSVRVAPPEPVEMGLADQLSGALVAMAKAVRADPSIRGALQEPAAALQQAVQAAAGDDTAAVAMLVQQALETLPAGVVPEVEAVLGRVLESIGPVAVPPSDEVRAVEVGV